MDPAPPPSPIGLARKLEDRHRRRLPLILDGATGTELERAGVLSELPLWSARALIEAPKAVFAVHRSWLGAGADVLTANTFRTQARTLARAGLRESDRDLSLRAVQLAREAAAAHSEKASVGEAPVVGSSAPLEDCYRPDLVPGDRELDREHHRHAENLALAGVDGILVETIGTLRELRAAVRAGVATGLPCWLSLIAATREADGATCLLSGESLERAVSLGAELGASALLVNCLPARSVAGCLEALAAPGLPFGAYPNMGAPLHTPTSGESKVEALPAFEDQIDPPTFLRVAQAWVDVGATLLGGCCGTRAAHLSTLTKLRPPARSVR